MTSQEERAQRLSNRNFFKTLSDLRGKERSLQHGDYIPLFNSTSALAYLRVWDQSVRYVAAVNWGGEAVTLDLTHPELPKEAMVRVSTDSALVPDSSVDLSALVVGPGQAVLLHFPYLG